MGNPVVHFEIGGPDGPALRQFYGDLFGWKIDVQGEEMGNYGIVPANEGGIGGGVLPTTKDMPTRSYVTFYVQVDDLQAALDKVAGMGGNAIMPPREIAPGMGSIALFGDPAENTIGLYAPPSEWDGQMPPKGDGPTGGALRGRRQRRRGPRRVLHRDVRLANRPSGGGQLPLRPSGIRRDWRRHLPAHGGNATQPSFRCGYCQRPPSVS